MCVRGSVSSSSGDSSRQQRKRPRVARASDDFATLESVKDSVARLASAMESQQKHGIAAAAVEHAAATDEDAIYATAATTYATDDVIHAAT